ncbi:MAG: hypothetical protein ACD_16C00126G0009 [uncultured bacterium]|nr:MAG: hypothetical protein ACD_16C00126G0009 [uncultured bacterium]OFW74834.1 MAG: hypothetical protein A2Z80_00240 [Alphaproteobacteria bacterium GWA2_41_27]OFW85020.1 MAG: hypothetical protein A2W06_04875 [Alphaproteobacteria bacterium RBG_16_42_14]OFW85238.1 MAG: hypothetical protein A3E50_07720 [Alphaproteobacteria bacterium RIFCSPHIGHO2_12_FULL_42_100]OFW92061.1 MAG: hypothetical protein A2W46_01485 [Alphaproteobacteria bacterium RIFCSPHIGHO2_12_42_13]OFW93112.1 MAG: hypothetical protei
MKIQTLLMSIALVGLLGGMGQGGAAISATVSPDICKDHPESCKLNMDHPQAGTSLSSSKSGCIGQGCPPRAP